MMLTESSPVSAEALPLAAFKDHLRLGSGFGEETLQDAVLESFLRAALANIEARTGKALFQRDFVWTLQTWRDPRGQVLPVAPVTHVQSVELEDRASGVSAVSPDAYRLAADALRPRLMPIGFMLPTIPFGGSAKVRLTAGYALNWASIPKDLAQAVLLLAAHYYEFRHETALGQGCMPFGVTSLLEPYKTMRLLGGAAS